MWSIRCALECSGVLRSAPQFCRSRNAPCGAPPPQIRTCGTTASAVGPPTMFGGFSGTTGPSDFPRPFITGVHPWASRCGLRPLGPQAVVGSPGSRARCFRTCSGSQTARAPFASRDGDALGVAFRLSPPRRHPGVVQKFRGSIPGPPVPLSTLHLRSHGRRRMARGRCGSLPLHRTKLPFATPRRF